MNVREHVLLAMRHDVLEGGAGANVLAADHARDVEALAFDLLEPQLELRALRRAGGIALDRLVLRTRRPKEAG
jgi:hypothetical protein